MAGADAIALLKDANLKVLSPILSMDGSNLDIIILLIVNYFDLNTLKNTFDRKMPSRE